MNSNTLEDISQVMRAVDAYAYDYKLDGKLAPSRHIVEREIHKMMKSSLDTFPGLLREESRRDAQMEVVAFGIEIEKLLCKLLGRPWAPSGFSIETLIADIDRRLKDRPAPFWTTFHAAWGPSSLRADYNKKAWSYVQYEIERSKEVKT